MKGKVKFPFRVKYNGVYYASGDTVKVDDVDEAISNGAEMISTDGKKEDVKEGQEAERVVRPHKKEQ